MPKDVIKDCLPQHIYMVTSESPQMPDHNYYNEVQYYQHVAPKRRDDFITGRNCARKSLQLHGVSPCSIPIGPNREPIWPDGITGSITHCLGFYAAATARQTFYRSIGIDAEPNINLPHEIWDLILTSAERNFCKSNSMDKRKFCRIIFSAKESIYKTIYPLLKEYVDFLDIEILIDGESETFTAKFPIEIAEKVGLVSINGKFATNSKHIFTAAFL